MKDHQNYLLAAICTLIVLSSGCAGLNDACYEHKQKSRAVSEYRKCGNPGCERYPKDYKLGWIDGFYAIATGGPDCPPAVAPCRYWDPDQILANCDNKRNAYYSGWQDGAARASMYPDTHHLRLFETCECPVPRCTSSCGDTECGPCGHSLGTPIHEELIELGPGESWVPSASKSSEPTETPNSTAIEITKPKTAVADGEGGTQGEEDVDLLELDQACGNGRIFASTKIHPKQVVSEENGGTLFGTAFDLESRLSPAVELQTADPLARLAGSDSGSEVAEATRATKSPVQTAQSIVKAAPRLQILIPVGHSEEANSEATLGVSDNRTDTEPVATGGVSIGVLPRKFEMIESESATVRLAK